MRLDWKAFGFGIGAHPFWWRLGFQSYGGGHYLYFGPLFISWKFPTASPERTKEQGHE